MPRQTRRKRRSFGTREEKIVNGRRYLYYSFPTPVEAFDKWPELCLGARQWRAVLPEDELEGEAWLINSRKAIMAGTWVPDKLRKARKKSKSITFRQYAIPWVEDRRKADGSPLKETAKQKYRESLDLYLLGYFGDMPMQGISPKDVQRWWDMFKPVRLDADLEDRRYHVYKHLKTILTSAATEPLKETGMPLLPTNPCQIRAMRPEVKHVPIRPTDKQMDAFLAALPDWAKLVARICDDAGLREGEALGLCREHIDCENLKIRVRQQVQRVRDGKGGHATVITSLKTRTSLRDAAMTATLAEEITAWMEKHHIVDSGDLLFRSPRTGAMLYGQNYRNAFANARKQVPGLETMRPHDLRKDALSRLSESGATTAEIMRQGGHASIAVASVYQTPGDQHMNAVMGKMNEYERARRKAERTMMGTADGGKPAKNPDPLTGVVENMPLEERIQLLAALTEKDRMRILEQMHGHAKIETMAKLLSGKAA